jgi:hypothetical protein
MKIQRPDFGDIPQGVCNLGNLLRRYRNILWVGCQSMRARDRFEEMRNWELKLNNAETPISSGNW